jgi:hypothetical protein
MSSATFRSTGYSAQADDDATPAWQKWLAALALLALISFLVAWMLGYIRFTTDPRILEVRKMQEDVQQKYMSNGGPSTPTEATEMVAAMGQIREKIQSLPSDLRQQVERRGGNMFRNSMRARIDSYFAAPPEKRQAELDRQIRQEEMMRKAMESGGMNGMFGGGPPGGGPPGGGGPGSGQGGGQTGGPGGQAGNGQGGRPRTEEDRNRWRKNIIDSTTPDQRARYAEYRRAMEVRRSQLGMEPRGPR